MFKYTLTVRPLVEPVTLDMLKKQVGEFSDLTELDDRLILALSSARETVEDETGLVFTTSSWAAYTDRFPRWGDDCPRVLELNRNPVQSVVSVEYRDSAGDWNVFAAENWDQSLSGRLARIALKPDAAWPDDVYAGMDAVRVSFVAGYTERAAIPRKLSLAVLMLAGHYYDKPEIVSERRHYLVQRSLDSILDSERVFSL